MQEENKKGKKPDYKGDGAAAWINKDKNGNEYLSVKILGSISVNLFPNVSEKDNKLSELNKALELGKISKESYAEEVAKLIA